MPNDVTTRCTVTGPEADVTAFKTMMIRPQEGERDPIFDFEGIIPMPEILRNSEAILYSDETSPKAIEAAKKALDAIGETGYASWYPWSIAKWGTKWNSYSFHLVRDEPQRIEFLFDTAWSFPKPVFKALAISFPGLKFECWCFDEVHCFAGRGFYNPGPDDEAFEIVDANDAIYEIVYGEPPKKDEDNGVLLRLPGVPDPDPRIPDLDDGA